MVNSDTSVSCVTFKKFFNQELMKFTQLCLLVISSVFAINLGENSNEGLKKSNWWWNRPAPVPAADPLPVPVDPLAPDSLGYNRSSYTRRLSTINNGYGF